MFERYRHPVVFAHRGASAHAPENTLPAFELALQHGADGVELDAKLTIEGEVIVCREAFISGPIDATDIEQFWNERAAYILSEYGEDEIAYHEKVADPLNTLFDADGDDDFNLWFEYDVFCSVNLWFCLNALNGSGAKVFRVAPSILEEEERWDGFAFFNRKDLISCYTERQLLSPHAIDQGAKLWTAFAIRDNKQLRDLSADPKYFPYLHEIANAVVEMDTRPRSIVREILSEGKKELQDVYLEFQLRAREYGFGDLQVERLIDQASGVSSSNS